MALKREGPPKIAIRLHRIGRERAPVRWWQDLLFASATEHPGEGFLVCGTRGLRGARASGVAPEPSKSEQLAHLSHAPQSSDEYSCAHWSRAARENAPAGF
jgi:hypothetical protein